MTAIEPQTATAAASPSVESENAYGKCKPEYQGLLKTLLSSYKPSARPTKDQRRQARQIHSLLQGHDGMKAECFKCCILADIEHMENHHIDNNPSNNKISNVPPIHGRCNRELNGAKGGEVNRQRAAAYRQHVTDVGSVHVSENAASAEADYGTSEWTSKEGKKHDRLRHKWNHNLWCFFNPEDEDINYWKKSELAAFARSRHFVGEGAISTFYKMIQEEIACHILKPDVDDEGNEIVRFVWPKEDLRPYLRELALSHIQGKLSDLQLKEKVDAIETTLELVQLWSYIWYVQKKIKQSSKMPK